MANIKLYGNTWDSSNIYDEVEGKTQKEVNAGKANTSGNYPEITAGTASQLIGSNGEVDKVPYSFRKTGGDVTSVGTRLTDKLVGGSIVWNQKITQSLNATSTVDGLTFTNNGDGSYTVSGTSTAQNSKNATVVAGTADHVYLMHGLATQGASSSFNTFYAGINGGVIDTGNGGIVKRTSSDSATLNIRFDFKSGVTLNNIKWRPQLFDLTVMFGSTIADYIYSLETATAGAGVAWFKSLFPNSYYAYNAGTLMSVQAASHETVGFNVWDEEWELGTFDADGRPQSDNRMIRSKNYIPCRDGESYYQGISTSGFGSRNIVTLFYGINKVFIPYTGTGAYENGANPQNGLFIAPTNARYMRFRVTTDYGAIYNNDICINLSDPAKNGTYEPYTKHSYPLDSTLTLRGIPRLDSNNKLYYDGDTYESDGTVTRRYGYVDLGTLTWGYDPPSAGKDNNQFSASVSSIAPAIAGVNTNIVCSKYTPNSAPVYGRLIDKVICMYNNLVCISDSDYSTTASFKTAMSGVYLVYELKTPTTESAAPYTNPQICDPNGTEEYVDAGNRDVAIPVGHETTYYKDLVDKIEETVNDFGELKTAVTPLYDFEYNVGENLFDITKLTLNKYVNPADGNLSDNSTYTASDFIDVSDFDYVLLRRKTLTGFAVRYCTYNANKEFIAGALYDANEIFNNDNYYGESIGFYRIDTKTASWLRFSATNSFFNTDNNPGVIGGYYPRDMKPYTGMHQKITASVQDSRLNGALTESVGGEYYNSFHRWIQNGRVFELTPIQALKGNESLYVFANIYTMGELYIGFLGDTYTLHIDGTNYWWNDGEHYAHNLTIKNYIAIFAELEEDGAKCNFRIETNGGEWTRTNNTFTGTRGKVIVGSAGFAGDINAVWMPKISKPIWVFGDSYISNYSSARWGYYLIDWGLSKQTLFDGYPGGTAQDAIVDFENLLTMGTPRYAVWCMGMNNVDDGAVNADWKTATDKFLSLCVKNGIVPILATIPNTPTRDHTYKNTYVKGLGYRYVDFAKAVNAESAASTWYDGMLEASDTPANRVHPTADGAICLATEFISCVPEVTYK